MKQNDTKRLKMERKTSIVLPEAEEIRPLPRAQRTVGVQEICTVSGLRLPRILLVDDDANTLEVLQRALRCMGYTNCTTASNGQEALLRLMNDPNCAELILCDLSMPDMDGIEFLQSLNAGAFRGSAIILSGQSVRVTHSVQRLLGEGQLTILGALKKPATRSELRALLECWRPQLQQPPKRTNLAIEVNELFVATQRNEWVVHYQPQVSLKAGALVGMEVLARWEHPSHGLLYPDQFIELAEQSGAIDGLTNRVMHDALVQRADWCSEGLNVQLSINISMASLRVPGFASRLTAVVQDLDTAPRHITLEITETQIGSSSGVPLENLIRLRLAGFTLSIDDFGTGNSSLAQLRDVPFTELKADRGFVAGAEHNQIIRPILEGSLGIAKRMGMTAVAEGIESEADWFLLKHLGCDIAQGYFIARPMPAHRVLEWLLEWQARLKEMQRP